MHGKQQRKADGTVDSSTHTHPTVPAEEKKRFQELKRNKMIARAGERKRGGTKTRFLMYMLALCVRSFGEVLYFRRSYVRGESGEANTAVQREDALHVARATNRSTRRALWRGGSTAFGQCSAPECPRLAAQQTGRRHAG